MERADVTPRVRRVRALHDRRGPRSAALTLAWLALAGTAGCGAATSSAAGGPSTAPAGAGATPTGVTATPTPTTTPGACPGDAGAAAAASPSSPVTLGRADAGRTVCVGTGTVVRVVMQGSHARPWRFALEGDALVPVVDRRESLPVDTQGAAYRAARPGTARIVGTQIACPAPRPGEVACMAVEQAWAVTVVVA